MTALGRSRFGETRDYSVTGFLFALFAFGSAPNLSAPACARVDPFQEAPSVASGKPLYTGGESSAEGDPFVEQAVKLVILVSDKNYCEVELFRRSSFSR